MHTRKGWAQQLGASRKTVTRSSGFGPVFPFQPFNPSEFLAIRGNQGQFVPQCLGGN